jgi:hypothetical protein
MGAWGHGSAGAWGTRNGRLARGLYRDAGILPAIPNHLLTQMNAERRLWQAGKEKEFNHGWTPMDADKRMA